MIIPPTRLPTDLEILKALYNLYYEEFLSADDDLYSEKIIYVYIDTGEIAKELNTDARLLSRRLFWLSEKDESKYTFIYGEEFKKHIKRFESVPGNPQQVIIEGANARIDFVWVTSKLADLREREEKFWTTAIIAGLAVAISFISLLYSIYVLSPPT